jgi:hypothetical protein
MAKKSSSSTSRKVVATTRTSSLPKGRWWFVQRREGTPSGEYVVWSDVGMYKTRDDALRAANDDFQLHIKKGLAATLDDYRFNYGILMSPQLGLGAQITSIGTALEGRRRRGRQPKVRETAVEAHAH